MRGNQFEIVLRDVVPDNCELVKSALEAVKRDGFINYFGMQRFGNCVTVPTHRLGAAILKSEFLEFMRLILEANQPPAEQVASGDDTEAQIRQLVIDSDFTDMDAVRELRQMSSRRNVAENVVLDFVMK